MDESPNAIVGLVSAAVVLAFVILMLVSAWKVFVKAGRPGWACLIPLYNAYVLVEMVGRPGWFVILLFIPLVNLYASFVVCSDLAKSFGKSTGFAVGLWLLGFVFLPILAFGDAQYSGAADQTA